MISYLIMVLLLSWNARVVGDMLEIRSDDGMRVLATHSFEGRPIKALSWHDRIYVATRQHGVYVFEYRMKRLKLLKKLTFDDPVKGIAIRGGKLFVVLVSFESKVYAVSSLKGGHPKGQLRYALRFPKPIDRRYTLKGSIIAVHDDNVILNKGRKDGLLPGAHVAIFRSVNKKVYDPITRTSMKKRTRQRLAVVRISQVQKHQAVAVLGMGDEAAVGDMWQWTDDPLTAWHHYRTLEGVRSVGIEVYPAIIFGRPGIYMNASAHYYGDLHVGASVTAGTMNVNAEYVRDAQIGAFEIFVSKEFNVFDLGMRMDGYYLTGSISGSSITPYVRLGRLDASHLLFGMRTNGSELNGVLLDLQIYLSRRYLAFLKVDARNQVGFVMLGSRVFVRGTGRAGTLIVPVYLGMAYHEYAYSYDDRQYDSQMEEDVDTADAYFIGGGVEYRF